MPAQQQILALQRTLGNRAVGELLARTTRRELARALLDEPTWRQRTKDFGRADDAKLVRLDELITAYAAATTFRDKARALRDLDGTASAWLAEHWIKQWTGTGLTPILNELKRDVAAALARAEALLDGGYDVGPWAMDLLDEVAARGLSGTALMDALFDALMRKLSSGFTYFSGGDPTFLDACAQANCQNLAGGLKVLAAALGLEVETEVISQQDFASRANTTLVSPHGGNVRFDGETAYTSKRFVFSMHVAAKYKGKYYDPTTRSTYASSAEAIGWRLREDGNSRRLIESVDDGATFPDGTAVSGDTAVLELDSGTTSQEFGYYWVVKRRPKPV